MKIVRLGIILTVCGLGGSLARANSVTTYFGQDLNEGGADIRIAHPNADAARASFFSNLSGVGTESFESFSDGDTAPITTDFGAAGTAVLSGSGNIVTEASGAANGRYPISGDNYWETTEDFSLTFTDPQLAFGFYGDDIGDFGGEITLTLADGSSTFLTVPSGLVTLPPNGSVLYYAIITSDPFTGISFGDTAAGTDYFAFDDFSIGTSSQVITNPNGPGGVPEPATLSVLGIGAAGLLLRRKKA